MSPGDLSNEIAERLHAQTRRLLEESKGGPNRVRFLLKVVDECRTAVSGFTTVEVDRAKEYAILGCAAFMCVATIAGIAEDRQGA